MAKASDDCQFSGTVLSSLLKLFGVGCQAPVYPSLLNDVGCTHAKESAVVVGKGWAQEGC